MQSSDAYIFANFSQIAERKHRRARAKPCTCRQNNRQRSRQNGVRTDSKNIRQRIHESLSQPDYNAVKNTGRLFPHRPRTAIFFPRGLDIWLTAGKLSDARARCGVCGEGSAGFVP